MTPLEQHLLELGLIEKKKKPEPVDRTPTDPWWKRGEECPH